MKASHAVLVALAAAVTLTSARGGRPRRIEAAGLCRQRLERDCASGDRPPATDGARADARHRHGPGRGLRRRQRHRPQPQAVPARPQEIRVGRRASQDAAAATAAYRVLLAITPTTRHEGLGTAYQATLAAIPDGPSEQGGVRAGEAAAAAMIAARQNDGFMAPFTPTIGTDAGKWRPIGWPSTPAFDPDGWAGNLKPFLIKGAAEFRTKGPNALTSAAYAKDFAEVKSSARCRARRVRQTRRLPPSSGSSHPSLSGTRLPGSSRPASRSTRPTRLACTHR